MQKKHLFITASGACLLCTLMFVSRGFDEKKQEAVSEQRSIESENADLIKEAPTQINKAQRFFEIAEKMEKKGEYALSAEFLLKAANEPFSMSNFETILSKTQKQIDLLSQANTKSGLSLFIPPDKDGAWDTIKKNKEVSAVGGYSTFFVPVVGPVIGIGSVLWLNKKATAAQRDAVRALPSTTIDGATARKIIDRYDYLKKLISFIKKKINVEILEDTSDIDALVALLQRVKSQKDAIRKKRTAYLSYEVISPILYEVNRQLFLADSDYLTLTGKDKETLDGAVKILALACHKDWLYQADETVREQFIDTQRVLKEVASKVELEEYKVVTTLSDSIDPSKKRGADAWW